MKEVVFDRVTGEVGVKRLGKADEEKFFGCNYVIDLLDPIFLVPMKTISAGKEWGENSILLRDWMPLAKTDDRYRFVNLFAVLEEGIADWEISYANIDTSNNDLDEHYINNPHEVFKLIKGLFV